MNPDTIQQLREQFEAAAAHHFVGVNKMIGIGKGGQREVEDLILKETLANVLQEVA